MSRIRLTRPVAAAAVLLLLPVLAACSGGAGAAPAATTKAPAPAADQPSEPTDAEAEAGLGGAGEGLCALVPIVDVNAALKPPAEFVHATSATGPTGEAMCVYASQDGDVNVGVATPTTEFQPFSLDSYSGPLHAVGGLGDKAGASDEVVRVLLGDTVLTVDDYSGIASDSGTTLTEDQLLALARLFVDKV